jgi:enoyl-CoA hydratase
MALAARIEAAAPLAVRTSKRVIKQSLEMTEADSWTLNNDAFGMIGRSADAIEGATAFAEKRAPNWSGK